MLNILMLAALPQEYNSFKRRTGTWRLVCRKPFPEFRCSFSDKEVRLVETGMGRPRIARALDWAVSTDGLPDLILSVGFGGSMNEALPVGQVILGIDFKNRPDDANKLTNEAIHLDLTDGELLQFCRKHHVRTARIVTVDRVEPKGSLSRYFHESPSLLDMESYLAARHALESAVPFLCFRAVSDGVHDEILYDLDEITSDGRVRILKVLKAVVKRPQLISEFYASWRRSELAASKLAEVLCAFLSLSAEELQRFVLTGGLKRGDVNL
jgi:nucleoside phosphorylase